MSKLPEGRFQVGTITGNKAIETLKENQFMVVGVAGTERYYRNNIGDEAEVSKALEDHSRLARLRSSGIIHGFVNLPCPALGFVCNTAEMHVSPPTCPESKVEIKLPSSDDLSVFEASGDVTSENNALEPSAGDGVHANE
jgi:hypothetical protein